VSATGSDESQIRTWPPISGVLDGRWLELEVYTNGRHTYLIARSQAQWVITREPGERIPSDVTKITIKVTDSKRRRELIVTRPRILEEIVGLYNSLGVIQPVAISCPLNAGGSLTVGFYGSRNQMVASASSYPGADAPWPASTAAWSCYPIEIRLARQTAPSLSGNVVTPLSKLLHTKLDQ
jgi:hypothetical protein